MYTVALVDLGKAGEGGASRGPLYSAKVSSDTVNRVSEV